MICRECESRLSDHIDGYLSPGEALRVERHLFKCARCSQIHADLKELVARSRALPELSPSPALWERIATEVAQAPAASFLRPNLWRRIWNLRFQFSVTFPQLAASAAGALAVIVALNVVVQRWVPATPGGAPLWNNAATTIEIVPLSRPMYDQHKLYSIASYQAIIDEKKDQWDPQIRMIFERGLASINSCLDECARAMQEDPDDPVSREMLEVAYNKKLTLLREFADL